MSESVSAAVTGIPMRGCAGVTATLPPSCLLVTFTVTAFVLMLASSVAWTVTSYTLSLFESIGFSKSGFSFKARILVPTTAVGLRVVKLEQVLVRPA